MLTLATCAVVLATCVAGVDITPQLLMSFLALLQVPLFGLAVGAGVLGHFARPPR